MNNMIGEIRFLLLFCVLYVLCDKESDIENGTELVMTFLVHRHGDRTPLKSYMKYSNDPIALTAAIQGFGYGQLTKKGRKRAYELGRFIRRRYGKILSRSYNSSEIYIRSTDYTRTKMTALSVAAGIYPKPAGEEIWVALSMGADAYSRTDDEDIWIPAPYSTVPMRQDFLLGFLNCPKYMEIYKKINNSNTTKMKKHESLLKEVNRYINFDMSLPTGIYAVYDLLKSQECLEVPLHPKVERLLPYIRKAAADANGIVFNAPGATQLAGGPILNEFLDKVTEVMSGEDSPRVNVYSGHDFDVAALAVASKITPGVGVPQYASALALELRKNHHNDGEKYFVVPVYLESPGQDVKYLDIESCGNPCELNKFIDLTSEYRISFAEWRKECSFDENLKIQID